MKKIFFAFLFLGIFAASKAQYAKALEIITELEKRKGINKSLQNTKIDDRKFVLVKEFDDHTERIFVIFKGKAATFVEVFDDKATGTSSSNVFSGDFVRTKNNMISLRADKLEGKKIAMPITKTFVLTQQKDILYLVDVTTRERWIDENSFGSIK